MPAKPPVLIAALSARALAASAKRAGYRPLVVDCFGDQDLAATSSDRRTLPAKVGVGLNSKLLLEALGQLAANCDDAPIGLVIGSGFEDRPRLMSKLAKAFGLLGTDSETTRALKDPRIFFDMLGKLGIAHPEFRFEPPENPDGWLQKRIGASGGLHIKKCSKKTKSHPRRYFQRQVDGEAISVLAIVSKNETAFALSKQWTSPTRRAPFRYGGAVSHVSLPQNVERDLLESSLAIIGATDARGLVSIDFVVSDDSVVCLEINPRPGASIDVHDDASGSLFEAHMIACRDGNPVHFLERNWKSGQAKAAAYLYADRGSITIANDNWPSWAKDCPRKGTVVTKGQPAASAHAVAPSALEAEETCLDRLAGLEQMLYDSQNRKETTL